MPQLPGKLEVFYVVTLLREVVLQQKALNTDDVASNRYIKYTLLTCTISGQGIVHKLCIHLQKKFLLLESSFSWLTQERQLQSILGVH